MLRFALLICLFSPAPAAAIGLCEGLVDTARVVAISESSREVAVRREVERCTETADGGEQRETLRYVEMRHLDTGKVKRRFAPDKQTDSKALSKRLGQPVGSWDRYTATLKDDVFQSLPAKASNRFCKASLSIESGALVAIVDGRDARNKPVRATIRLLTGVEPGNRIERMARLWFARHGTVLVADVEAPVTIDQGALGKTSAHRSLVKIVGPLEAPVLKGCATPRPPKHR